MLNQVDKMDMHYDTSYSKIFLIFALTRLFLFEALQNFLKLNSPRGKLNSRLDVFVQITG